MDALQFLLDILIVLLAAKLAAEAAERIGLPAVVGEIIAGVLVGPSVLGLVAPSEVLSVLAELGVILLLLDVGLEMDLGELGAVGRAALTVAVVGVVVPFATGAGAGLALGFTANEAIFVGAALTATSVGISARVFGDLRALATVEARTVLGAAVADDVIGLIILTVVVRLVEAGSVSATEVGGVVIVAIGFLVISLGVGVRLVPPLFAMIGRSSRSAGTLVALALAFALAIAELADAAKLAPIVGAFVAGVSLARSPVADRVRRELAPVGHLFVPVFFLQIGIDTDVGQFFQPSVLGIAGVLLVVAILGKLVSAVGLVGAPGDRLLVGVGMIPRGEVGLIFATIGLRQGVFGDDIYAALLLVVLVTTLLTPPLLRLRLLHVRRSQSVVGEAEATEPASGWLRTEDGRVDLAAQPPPSETLVVALRAALLGEHLQPGAKLLDWLSTLPDQPLAWTGPARTALFDLLERGGPRAWRFLTVTGVLARALPELDDAVSRRAADPFDLDPMGSVRWPRLARLRELGALDTLRAPDQVALAALVLDATDTGDEAAPRLAQAVIGRLGLGPASTSAVVTLTEDAGLLLGAARRIDGFDEVAALQLAAHIGSVEQARALHMLTRAGQDLDPSDAVAVAALYELLVELLSRPESLASPSSVEARRAAALDLVADPLARDALKHAPPPYLLTQLPTELARQAALCSPTPRGDHVRVLVTAGHTGSWRIEIAAADRVGLLAHEARVLGDLGLDVVDANVVVWPDGCALGVFGVRAFDDGAPSADRLQTALTADLSQPLATPPTPDVELRFDDTASPWHTICEVGAGDRFGLLALVTAAFAAAGISVHAARIATVAGVAVDQFELSGARGAKVTAERKEAIRAALTAGVASRRRGGLRIR